MLHSNTLDLTTAAVVVSVLVPILHLFEKYVEGQHNSVGKGVVMPDMCLYFKKCHQLSSPL